MGTLKNRKYMKRFFKYLALLSLPVLLAIGCVKDDGNYDYVELPEMTVTNFDFTINGIDNELIDDEYILTAMGDEIIITPNVDIDASIEPEYLWIINLESQDLTSGTPIPADTLGTDKNLTYNVSHSPNKYNIRLRITDKKNPKYVQYFKLPTVVEALYGLIILDEKNGLGDISALKTVAIDKYTTSGIKQSSDIFSLVNDGEKLIEPTFIYENTAAVYKTNFDFYIGGKGHLTRTNIELENTGGGISDVFHETAVPLLPNEFTVKQFGSYYAGAYLIVDNKLYANTQGGFFGDSKGFRQVDNRPNTTPENQFKGEYVPYIAIDHAGGAHVAYNKMMNRYEKLHSGGFGVISSWWSSYYYPTPALLTGADAATAETLEPVHFGFSNAETTLAPSKDASENMFCVKMNNFDTDDNSNTVLEVLDIFPLANATATSQFAYGVRGNYMFYSEGNKVYTLNTVDGSEKEGGLNISSDETISKLYIFRNEESDLDALILYIATYNSAGEGKIYQYNFNAISGIIDTATKVEATGYGKIVDMIYVAPLSN